MTDVDPGLFLRINGFARATGWLHPLMVGWASYGVAAFAMLMVLGWWQARRRGDAVAMAAALWAPLATLVAVGINQPIVQLVAEPRPYTALSGILVLADQSSDPSFPSDHAVMAGAAACALFVVSRRLGEVAVVAAVLLAFARIYIGAHYPHDVVFGLGLGVAVAVIGWVLLQRLLIRVVVRLTDSRWSTLVTTQSLPVST